MTARDHDRLIRAFLTEGTDELPDRAYDAVRGRIEETRQRVVIGPWREPRMPTVSRIALAAAAVIVAVVVGLNLQLGQGLIGSFGSTPSPTPSPSPSPSPSPRALPSVAELEPGTYVMPTRFAQREFTFTVPAGWSVDEEGFVTKNRPGESGGALFGGDAVFHAWNVTHVYRDACQWRGSLTEAGTTAFELASLLAAQRGRDTTEPLEVTVGGRGGYLVETELPSTTSVATCDGGFARVWPDPGGDETGGFPAAAGQTDRIHVVDVDGARVVIVATSSAGTPADDVVELRAIVESVRFAP